MAFALLLIDLVLASCVSAVSIFFGTTPASYGYGVLLIRNNVGYADLGGDMKHTKFAVWFSNGNYEPERLVVSALNQNDALILAQAERIKDGLDYTLHKIEAL